MKPYVVGFIFARGGSKGVPRKNIRLLAGKPLIAYAIETARSSELVNRIIVSTEDAEIAEVAKQYGAEVPFVRPKELAQDDSPEWSAWQHAVQALQGIRGIPKIDAFISIPPTSPLRGVEDVDACIRMLLHSDADLVITVKPGHRRPYYNMVTLDQFGYARLVWNRARAVPNRQSSPMVFDMTTVAYAARAAFVLNASSMFEGKVKAVVVPPERALDIDTELDFRFAEFLLGYPSQWKEPAS